MRPTARLQARGVRRTDETDLGLKCRNRDRRKLVGVGVAGGVEPQKEQEYSVRRYNTKHILLLLLILVELFSNTEATSLNSYISYFEPVYFDSSIIKRQLESHRVKRSLVTNTVNLDFKAQNRLFRLRLAEDSQNIFSDDVTFESTNGKILFDKSKIFSGFLEDDEFSRVDGIFTSDGLFDGHIQTRDTLFYVEPAKRYFKSEDRPEFPAVIYSIDDVKHPHSMHHNHNHIQSSCASHQLHLKAKERWLADRSSGAHNQSDGMFESLPESPNFHDGVLRVDSGHSKSRRQRQRKRSLGEFYSKKTTCMLYLQADHLFYEMKDRSEEACIEEMTRHVQRVNSIYRAVDFDLDGKPDNISFMIKRIKVHSQEALKDPTYRFPGNYGVEKFLEIFSEEDYDHFCLSYMFTYRDFEGGTLGLAWTGDLKNAGGVCEKHGHYRGSYKSLNTGIITLMNYGKPVPPAVSHVTMAHEMGHNFGSPHDPEADKDCVPGGEDGNYIMYARATSGDRNNNKKFSPCSLRSISQVLSAKALGPKGCFTAPEIAICGNGVVEEGEECDCGWEEDCLESCCWPQRTKYTQNQLPCTLRPTAVCSPSQGPCCGRDCGFSRGAKCRDDNGCREDSYCDGGGVLCPQSIMKPNKTVCNEEFVCFQGECTGSICLAYGLESCQCMQGEGDSETKPCELCCKLPGPNSPCRSSFEWTKPPHDVPNMYSKAGTPCNNYQGYCDVFKKCREVDPLGPLLTLHDILFSDSSIKDLRNFITKYWYSVILAAVAVIALMITIIKLCGKKTPLVHHRRHRRRKVHHSNNQTAPAALDSPDEVHVHPTTVQEDVSRPRRKRKESSKRERGKSSSRKESKKYESAQALADQLTAKISSVIPDTHNTQYNQNGSPGKNKTKDQQKQPTATAAERNESNHKAKKSTSEKPDLIEIVPNKEATSKNSKDKNEQQQPKEVTIAKLGPFKMSLEVKKNEEAMKSKERENKSSRKPSHTTNPSATDKTSQSQKRKKRSRSKSEGRRKESNVETKVAAKKEDQEDQLYEELDVKPQPAKEVNSGTRKTKKSKDKIVVSKLVKSDRPLREKSPEKKIKYSRSISQPAPPANLELLLPPESQTNLSRNLSLGAADKEKSRRSAGTSSASAASGEENISKRRKQLEKMSLYDNDGFDSSPTLARKVSGDCRQQKFLSLKEQIHHQLRLAAAAASSESGTVERRGRRGAQQYLPMEEMEGGIEDSDCSDPQSPPTQIQSLSEESSGGSTRRAVKFDSSDESEHPLASLGLVHNSRHHRQDSDSDTDNDCKLPVSTVNPHVRVPEVNPVPVPVPLPRTSLHYDKLNVDQGCESDATIDIRNYSSPRSNTKAETEDWEVAESSDESDENPTDIDNTDTDGIAQQMMY